MPKSWRLLPEWQHREDNPDVHMRPGVGKLIHKIKNLKMLQEHPDSVPFFLQQVAYHYFVHERLRPLDAFRAFEMMHGVWQGAMGYPTALNDVGNDRQLEIAQNAVAGDDASEKVSLPRPTYGDLEDLYEYLANQKEAGFNNRLLDNLVASMKNVLDKQDVELPLGKLEKKRNNATPGPTHKSPVGWQSSQTGPGFIIPNIDGKFMWTATSTSDKPPDMDRVIAIIAQGIATMGLRNLDDKKLKKSVRLIIQDHPYEPYQKKGVNYPTCSCGESFDDREGWASHVRKLIWKELERG